MAVSLGDVWEGLLMPTTVQPLPCPWCLSAAFVAKSVSYWVECDNVHCHVDGPMADTEADAIAAWNRVASVHMLVEETARLRKESEDRVAEKPILLVILLAVGTQFSGHNIELLTTRTAVDVVFTVTVDGDIVIPEKCSGATLVKKGKRVTITCGKDFADAVREFRTECRMN